MLHEIHVGDAQNEPVVAHTIVAVGQPLPKPVLDRAVDPTAVAHQSFDLERRGYDQHQVQQYLRAVAESLRDAQRREADMRTRLGKAVRRAEAAEQTVRTMPRHDVAELNRQCGEQVTEVLEAARRAGDARLADAEETAADIVEQAEVERAERLAELIEAATAEAEQIIEQARAEAAATLARTAERIEQARDHGDALIHEAEQARAQILEDMERRRRQARAQVERLRVGRDRLLRSYEVVRRTLEETTVELKSSLNEAKVRGDGAARAVLAEPPVHVDQLEAELRDAKMIGRISIPPLPADADRESIEPSGAVQQPASKSRKALRSPALPRPLDPPPSSSAAGAPAPARRRPARGANDGSAKPKKRTGVPPQPKAPAAAPRLTGSPSRDDEEAPLDPIAAMIAAAEAKEAGTAAPVPAGLAAADPDRDTAEADVADAGTAETVDGGEVEMEDLEEELARLEDHNLAVVDPSDEIEQVIAVPIDCDDTSDTGDTGDTTGTGDTTDTGDTGDTTGTGGTADADSDLEAFAPAEDPSVPDGRPGLFDALRAQSSGRSRTASTGEGAGTAPASDASSVGPEDAESAALAAALDDAEILAQRRDAIVADASHEFERRLKRALADEQNELLAAIRSAATQRSTEPVSLTALIGDVDAHIGRYVVAIHEVAALTYGAGAALVHAEPPTGHLPAGAVEELLVSDVIRPIRERLESLDGLAVDEADLHVDPVRAFYRQRKTDHLGPAASRLANLLCVAGLCDALPADTALPWAHVRQTQPA